MENTPETANHYHLLGISAGASRPEIEEGFRKRLAELEAAHLAPALHEREMNRLLDAYAVLITPERKETYDRQLQEIATRPRVNSRTETSAGAAHYAGLAEQQAPKPPTFTQLLDFDFESLENKPPKDPITQKKEFWDQVYFKAAIFSVVLFCIALIYWLLQNPRH
jgi:curved DNA-binding protein CbpA